MADVEDFVLLIEVFPNQGKDSQVMKWLLKYNYKKAFTANCKNVVRFEL
jgi:hypothetical protein